MLKKSESTMDKKMIIGNRIAIDLSVTHATNAGTATYVKGLLSGLKDLNHEYKIETMNYKKIFNGKNRILKVFDTIRREIFWIHFELPNLIKKNKISLLHSPSLLAPNNLKIPCVITVCDLYVLKNKKAFNTWQVISSDILFKRALFNVDKIIAISHYTKSEIIQILPQIPESKIVVVHLGVEKHFHEANENEKKRINNKYLFQKPFILSVCTIEPRKNLKKTLEAFALIADKIEHDFILVGSYGWKSSDLYSFIADLNLTNRVRFLGFVPKEDLPGIYSSASVFIYASLYEGFGLPPLEAMACGCPVVSSNCTSIPEVVGDAGLLINPNSKEDIADAILRICTSDELQKELRIKGLQRAADFSWSSCAEKTYEVYNTLLKNSNNEN